jgi:hypothetical protein
MSVWKIRSRLGNHVERRESERHRVLAAAVLAAALWLAITSARGEAQVLTVNPTCGAVGSTFSIGGSGWAEPNPLCHYTFTLGGESAAPDQPDGLYGPPHSTGTVPNLAPGSYEMQTQLLLEDGTELQCVETPFEVVSATADPFDGGTNIQVSGTSINITFDPTGVCAVTDCTQIVSMQVLNNIGTQKNGTTRDLSYADLNWDALTTKDGATDKDNATTSAGYLVDFLTGENQPYYNSSYKGTTSGQEGMQGAMPKPSMMGDGPRITAPGFPTNPADPNDPTNIISITKNFEDNFFCAQGDNVGEWLGNVQWNYTQTLANAQAGIQGTTTLVSEGTGQPSANFLAAVNQWGQNPYPGGSPNPHPFSLPSPTPPTVGGTPCD